MFYKKNSFVHKRHFSFVLSENAKETATSKDMIRAKTPGKEKITSSVNLCNYEKFNICFCHTFEI